MKKAIIFYGLFTALLFTVFSCGSSRQAADTYTRQWRYEMEPVNVGTQGTYLVKIWSYSKKPVTAIEQAKKNAVHGIIFRGFAGMNGVLAKRPLTNNPNLEQEKKDFFDPFFAEGGKYMKFVTITNDGTVAAKDRLKVGNEYKIGVIVSINVDLLRKDLEDAGIIQRMGAGFAK
ncbi:MAG: hypothetical protein LBK58_06695 [Prevotellaceae bacterium]|jgi:hypothetical protein|nr:hypothetical protein [Prevotellaceae bacterium]